MVMQNIRQKSAAAVAVVGMGVMLVGCSASARPESVASQPGMSSAVPVTYTPPVALDNTRVVRTAYPVTREAAAPERVAYQSASARVVVRKPTRSVQKSALIIGGSAAGGAGIGAAIGGKKGALIGALLGGGGATVWDQITRRKQ